MSAQTVIDSLEFAGAGQELRGSLPVAGLTRLQDCLFDSDGRVEFAVRGGRDAERRPILTLEITGSLHLQCQRCLGSLDYPLRLSNRLLLVSKGEDLSVGAEDPDAPDCIEASPQLDVALLIEDEILLSLPFSPRHAEGACQSALGRTQQDADRSTAFSKLRILKRV